MKNAKNEIEASAQIEPNVFPNESGLGLSDLANRSADLVMISSSIDSIAKKLNNKQPGFILFSVCGLVTAAFVACRIGEPICTICRFPRQT